MLLVYAPCVTQTGNQGKFLSMDLKMAIKTGVVAALAWFVGEHYALATGRPETFISGLWCVVASIVVVQEHLGAAYKVAVARFIGIGIGSLTGGLFTMLLGASPLSLGVSVGMTVALCSLFNLKESVRFASLSSAVVMVSWAFKPLNSPWEISLYRFLDSVVGIAIAIVVVHVLWPEQATKKLRESLSKAIDKLNRLFTLSVVLIPIAEKQDESLRPLVDDIEQILLQSHTIFDEAKMELVTKTNNIEIWSYLLEHLQTLLDSILSLQYVYNKNVYEIFDQDLVRQLDSLIRQTEAYFRKISAMLIYPQNKLEAIDLTDSLEKLKQELIRFRAARPTRQFPLPDIQNFFVFFYSLKTIVEELRKMEKRIEALHLV